MPNVRRGVVNSKKQATVNVAKVDFVKTIQAAQDAKSVAELRMAVSGLAGVVKTLAMAAGLWKETKA